ncbi:AAA domain-containing protein [Phytobacter ursingii]
MKIKNHGRGIHEREIPGIEYFTNNLPDEWIGHTNLTLSLPFGGREIDLIIFAVDRIFMIDLKDGHGQYASIDSRWSLNGQILDGQSPVRKILDNARETSILLKNFWEANTGKKTLTPKIIGIVVLTNSHKLDAISPVEVASVLTAKQFVKISTNTGKRLERFGPVSSDFVTDPIYSTKWRQILDRFFNVDSGPFKRSMRKYGEYVAIENSDATYQHPQKIYQEFAVHDASEAQAAGLLRCWDFSQAETRFQTESGRTEIAGRERSIIGWLNDRSESCANAILQPKAEDGQKGVDYWEVYDLRKRMRRLSEFVNSELPRLRPNERIDLARQLIYQIQCLHQYQTAHLDIGKHSVWVAPPSEVKISHLMAARYPEANSLGSTRYQFLSSVELPDEALAFESTPEQKDVFHLGVLIHLILFGKYPNSNPPEWLPEVDVEYQYQSIHNVLSKALAWDNSRYSNAMDLLEAFNKAANISDTGIYVIKQLERFKSISSQRQLFREYPESEELYEDDFTSMWISIRDGEKFLVKLWKRASWSDGSIDYPRILDFLKRAEHYSLSPLPGCAPIYKAYWLSDSFSVVQHYIDTPNLANHALMCDTASLESIILLKFSLSLINAIITLHDMGITHGDLKPDNVLILSDGDCYEPLLIDYLDFCCVADGELKNTAYSPTSGGTLERDRFAVTKIIEEIINSSSLAGQMISDIHSAIAECRKQELPNATLLPLKKCLSRILTPESTEERKQLSVALSDNESGEMLADEGVYGFGFKGSKLFIRGIADILYITFENRKIHRVNYISSARQAEHKQLLRHQKGVFSAKICIIGGVQDSYSDLSALLEKDDFKELIEDKFINIEQTDDDNETATEFIDVDEASSVTKAETNEDSIVELIENTKHFTKASIPELWQTMVDVESNLTNEATTLGSSSFRKELRVHAVPITLECGTFEFSRADKVTIEKLGNDNRWRKIGTLDIPMSSAEFIYIYDGGRWASSGALLDAEQRIRFQSQLHSADITRREAAVRRIVNKKSVNQNLIDYFDSDKSPVVLEQAVEVDINEVRGLYGLNQRQAEALIKAFQVRPISLLQGPPGTGKTKWIGALVHYALSHNLVRNVLIASQSHEAVNNAAQAVLKLYPSTDAAPSMIRIGHEEKVSDPLLPYHVAKVEQLYKDTFRATLKERLLTAAASIGIPSDVAEQLVQIETTLAPVIKQLNYLATDTIPDGVADRIKSLLLTVEKISRQFELEFTIPSIDSLPKNDLMSEIYDYAARKYSCAPDLISKLRVVSKLTQDIVSSVSSAGRSFETFLAGTRQIVAGTCVGLGRSSLGLTSTTFDLVIVDEAARCSASELAVPMQAGRWIVLVGDQKQLEPKVQENVVEIVSEQTGFAAEDIVKSAFEQVFDSRLGEQISQKLNIQYRMLPPIGRLVANAFYDRDLEAGRNTTADKEKVVPPGLTFPLTWIYTDEMGPSAHQKPEGNRNRKSLINLSEAEIIVSILTSWSDDNNFLNWLRERENSEPAIGIICTYSAQASIIRNKLQLASLSEDLLSSLKIDTVDSYQGKENRIVILSLVRNNTDGVNVNEQPTIKPGFMSRPNRINVAASRAMDWLIIVGAKDRWLPDSPMAILHERFNNEVKLRCGQFINAIEMSEISKTDNKGSFKDSL